jgi:hypothetical protein
LELKFELKPNYFTTYKGVFGKLNKNIIPHINPRPFLFFLTKLAQQSAHTSFPSFLFFPRSPPIFFSRAHSTPFSFLFLFVFPVHVAHTGPNWCSSQWLIANAWCRTPMVTTPVLATPPLLVGAVVPDPSVVCTRVYPRLG